MPRILVLNDTRDHDNWGSQACAQALIDILEARIPGAEIETYSLGWMLQKYRMQPRWLGGKLYRAHKLGRLERRFTKAYGLAPYVVDEYEFVAKRWLGGSAGPGADEYVADLRRMDAVVFNAEGSTYRANHVALLAIFMLWLARTHFDLPAFFLNGTVALTDIDRVLPGMVRKTFPVLDGITVREPWSARNVAAYVPDAHAELVPDSVFANAPEAFRNASPAVGQLKEQLAGQPYFVLSSSMLPIDFLRSRQQSSIVRLVQELKKVVPQAVLTGKDQGDQWMRQIAAMTDAHYFGPEHSYGDLAALLESAAVLVSGRYHNIILSSIVGCPTVPLTTTSTKIDGLCELMDGMLGGPFDVTDLWTNMSDLVARADDHVTHRDTRRDQLLELAARHREATGRMGDIVQAVLAGAPPPAPAAPHTRRDLS